MSESAIRRVTGSALVLTGDDIDTDRIMPARFLRAISFEGLEAHLFEDDRKEAADRGAMHPFADSSRASASILIVGRNFGCGSSREHAPQAIRRRGIRAVVGESFAEIFFTNSVAIGLPCVSVPATDRAALAAAAERDRELHITVDLEAGLVTAAGFSIPARLPDSARKALTSGEWDAMGLLLADYDDVRKTKTSLPYISGF